MLPARGMLLTRTSSRIFPIRGPRLAVDRQRRARCAHSVGSVRPQTDERAVSVRDIVIPLPAHRQGKERLGGQRTPDLKRSTRPGRSE